MKKKKKKKKKKEKEKKNKKKKKKMMMMMSYIIYTRHKIHIVRLIQSRAKINVYAFAAYSYVKECALLILWPLYI
jgi:hypothetical protein